MEKLPFLTAILDSPDKFCSGVAIILAEVFTGVTKILAEVGKIGEVSKILAGEVGKILAGVWTGIANVFDKLKPILEVLAEHHVLVTASAVALTIVTVLPQILVFLFLTAVLHHFHN